MTGGQFWPFAQRLLHYKWIVVLALAFATLSAGGLGAGLVGIKPILDAVLGAKPKGLPELAGELNQRMARVGVQVPQGLIDHLPTGAFNAVLWIIISLGVLTIIGAVCNFLHAYLSLTVISRTVANIRRECFHQVVHLPLRSVVSAGPSDLISRIVYDTATLASGFNALLGKAAAQITKGVVAVVVAFWYDWRIAGVALLVAPILGIIIRKLGKRIRRASKRALESQASLFQVSTEVLSGLRVVKSYSGERHEEARFHKANMEVIRQEFRVRTARALSSPLVETISILVLGVLFLIAVKAILDGHLDKTNSLAVLGALGLAAAQLKPLTALINDMQQASAAGGRLAQLLGYASEPGHDARLPALPPHSKSIRLENIRLTYPGSDRPAVDDLTLDIASGQTIAIVGPNGCGKSTLLSLVPRLFDPDAGAVLIDGHDIRAFSIRSLRAQIGVVTQDTVLFRGSIRDNIAYAIENADMQRIRDAAKAARADHFIIEKPGEYEHQLTEGGGGLSGGQRQRLAIARAILRNPRILILDEATSMIDAESEAQIAEAIADFVSNANASPGKGRTCLIVAHRLSTVIAADKIVVMDQGRIVDQGTHTQLLDRCDLYRTLAHHQLLTPRR